MYLISVYFDELSDKKIRGYMKQIAKHTGNYTMLDGDIPPHMTIAAFQADSPELAKRIFERVSEKVHVGKLQWVSVGTFLPQVIYIAPVLNEYIQQLSEITYKEVTQTENVWPCGNYRPYAWMPHATIAKQLTKEQMKTAFEVMQNQFGSFESTSVKLGLAKTNPHKDLAIFELK